MLVPPTQQPRNAQVACGEPRLLLKLLARAFLLLELKLELIALARCLFVSDRLRAVQQKFGSASDARVSSIGARK